MNDIQLKDVLHYYLGCEIYYPETKETSKVSWTHLLDIDTGIKKEWDYKPSFLLSLSSLDSITEEEAIELAKIHKYDIPEDEGVREEIISIYDCKEGETLTLGAYLPVKYYLHGLIYLLSKGFDLFGLIERNLAINKNANQ